MLEELAPIAAGDLPHDREQQLFFALEVVVEEARRHPGFASNVFDRGPGVAIPGHAAVGRVDYLPQTIAAGSLVLSHQVSGVGWLTNQDGITGDERLSIPWRGK